MTLPANIRVNASAPFPAQVRGSGVVAIAKANGVWTVSLNFAALPLSAAVPSPATTYVLVWDAQSGTFYLIPMTAVTSQKIVKIIAATPYAALPTDDVLIIKPAVAAPFAITVDWSQRTKPLTVVDGKPMATANNISITPSLGQTQMGTVNYVYVIDSNGGTVTLTPLPDNTGAY